MPVDKLTVVVVLATVLTLEFDCYLDPLFLWSTGRYYKLSIFVTGPPLAEPERSRPSYLVSDLVLMLRIPKPVEL